MCKEDLEPLRHLIADLKSEKDKQQQTHPIIAAQLSPICQKAGKQDVCRTCLLH